MLKDHFKNSRFACDNDEYLPVVFSPPRDGKHLVEPVTVGGRSSLLEHGMKMRAGGASVVDLGGASSTTASTQAPSDEDEGDGDGGSDETGSGISDQLAALQLGGEATGAASSSPY